MHARAATPYRLHVMIPLLAVLAGSPGFGVGIARAAAEEAPATGVVLGRIVLGEQQVPAAFALVVLMGTRRSGQADEDGRFRIDRVPAGKYVLRIHTMHEGGHTRGIDVPAAELDLGRIVLPGRPDLAPVEIGSRAAIDASELSVTIRPTKDRFFVGEAPSFVVRIENRGSDPTVLIESVDGSDSGSSPIVTIQITGPEGGIVVRPYGRCGNRNGLRLSDFSEVAPGEAFDPFGNGGIGTRLAMGSFARPGKYTATVRYSTGNRNARAWMGLPNMGRDLHEDYRDLLAQVPLVDLTAKTSFRVLR